jgi:hypothetical protein
MYPVSLEGENNANKFFAAKQIKKVLLNKKAVLQQLKKRYSVSLEGEKIAKKFCATEQNKKRCKTINSGTAVP